MPDLTVGRVLMALGLLLLLLAAWQALAWLRDRSFGRGTPQYARARDGRRYALVAFLLAVVLISLGYSWRLFSAALGLG